jgi:type VI secretion system secreted protein VgrG
MATYTQEMRPISVTTPLGKDALLLVGFTIKEAISQLFDVQLDLVAENHTEISFDQLLGQNLVIRLTLMDGKERFFSGICSRFGQGRRDEAFTLYRMEVVPQFWLLTRRSQSRIFQHMSVPDILKKVLTGLDVAFELQGSFQPRDYCSQYRESDFAFASRLMEEEGIYYFFKHSADGHKMVVANTPHSHPDVPEQSEIIYDEVKGGTREEMRIYDWEKVQELRAGKCTLWDHCFELPHKHLEASKTILDSVQVGQVTHKLKVGNNDKLEIYDYPGAYAQRFDGVDKGGGDNPADLQKIFDDNKRTVEIRMQQEALPSLQIRGGSNCRQLVAGHKFTLERHFNSDGQYVLTSVEHTASLSLDYRSGEGEEFVYENKFTCIPVALPFRPPLVTKKPVVDGPQTAVVVGPVPKEEIWCDKYGRVKVQFHWDRDGKYNENSSCWIRVATAWAGKGWGQINIPRIGHEVIVDFLEGDPDNPVIVGSVYNAENMPAKKLPEGRKISGLVSRTNKPSPGFNQITCDDTKDNELIQIHGQFDMQTDIEHDERWNVKNDCTITVDGKHTETIDKDTSITIKTGNFFHDVKTGTAAIHVKGAVQEKFEDSQETIVKNGIHIASETAHIYIHTATSIQLHVGKSSIWMDEGGQISIKGMNVSIEGKESVAIKGGRVVSAADTTHEIQGGNVKSDATGNNVVKGAMVMLNPGG